MSPIKITLAGRAWTLRFPRSIKDKWGDCCVAGRTIRVSQECQGEKELDVLIHEQLHAVYPFLEEEMVCQAATEIAANLWKLKYRRETERG